MWITGDVNLPRAVVDAQAAGELVIFVGAGASMGHPSNLPTFNKLARDLAGLARVPFDEETNLDAFLGALPANFDVHTHTRDMIARPTSAFNPTHSAIVELASTSGTLRIVTTNFDDHLASAATAASIPFSDKYIGPALPLGDDFSGIVHLHGSIGRPPRELVLTDRDFGRAYLTDAWATRFLQRMFDRFVVLFVGYSHDDPIMRYLALGLPSRTRRFALDSQPGDPKWERLGIEAIGYPDDNNHIALVTALEAWRVRARMGLVEHRAQMRDILDAGPPPSPVEADYLHERVMTVEGARHFAELARGEAWLKWAESLPTFQGLFTAAEGPGEVATILAGWFADYYAADPSLHATALRTIQRLGQSFNAELFRSLCWAAERLTSKDPDAGRRWKVLLSTSIPGQSAPPDLGYLLSAQGPGGMSEHRAVLRSALSPYLRLQHPWNLGEEITMGDLPRAELVWPIDEDSLTQLLMGYISNIEGRDDAVGVLLEEALNRAYDLLDAYGTDGSFDRLAFRRSAIEQHAQDRFREPVDAVVDALREYGAKILATAPDLPERWWNFSHNLFRRLAIHLVGESLHLAPDAKIRWILSRGALFDSVTKHETFLVLAQSVQAADVGTRAELLARVEEGPKRDEGVEDADRHDEYEKYNALVWLTRADQSWSEAVEKRSALEEMHNFAPRDHPDMDRWMEVGRWQGQLPIEPDEFIMRAQDDASAALDELLSRDYPELHFRGPTWDDALTLIRTVCETKPNLGVALWRVLDLRQDLDIRGEKLRQAVAEGWTRADLGAVALEATHFVTTLSDFADATETVARFLSEQIRKQADQPESEIIAAMRTLALTLWKRHKSTFRHQDELEPASLALNSWPGHLTHYWIGEVVRHWQEMKDDWTGMSAVEQEAFTALLSGPATTLDAIVPALAGDAFLLHSADPQFAERFILPLFSNPERSSQAWNSYLYHPRCNDRMLAQGLLKSVIDEFVNLEDLMENHRELATQFIRLAASIVSFAGITPDDRREVLHQTVLVKDGQHASDFAAAILDQIEGEEPVQREELWDRWIREHVRARFDGLPREAQKEELERWADLVPFLGRYLPEGIEIVAPHNLGLGKHYRTPDFPADALNNHSHELVAYLADRVRNSASTGWRLPHQVQEMVGRLSSHLGDRVVEPLVDAATERGFRLE